MAKTKKSRSYKQLRADRARSAVHVYAFTWPFVPQTYQQFDFEHTACGKSVAQWAGQKGINRALVRNIAGVGDITCGECARQLEMARGEHQRYMEQREAEKRAKLDRLRERQQEQRAQVIAERKRFVAHWTEYATVACDAVLEGRDYPELGQCLEAAKAKQQLAGTWTTGKRLWKFSGEPNASPLLREREIVCRFCMGSFGRHKMDGYDYTYDDFSIDGQTVNLNRHTVLCALAYLGGFKMPEPLPGVWNNLHEGA